VISFIIPAYNEEAMIGATIDALHKAGCDCGQSYEIIVADDASTDRTEEVARHHNAAVVNVNKRQIAAVRNAGAAAATGDVLIFVDADTIVPPRTVELAMQAIGKGAVGGGAMVRFEDDASLATRAITRCLMEMFRLLRSAAGCFIFCRRNDFHAIGGFDERYFASEEVWISRALRKRGKFVMVRHPVTTSGRKIRMHGLGGLLWQMLRVTVRGFKGVQRREGLELWYDGRRESPASTLEKSGR